MDRSEFAKKVVELMKEKGDVFYSAVRNMNSVSGHFTALSVLGLRYIDAKKYAIINLVSDVLAIAYVAEMSPNTLEKYLKRIEDVHMVKPDYDAIYWELLKYIEIAEKPVK